jgi:hypothetical protein
MRAEMSFLQSLCMITCACEASERDTILSTVLGRIQTLGFLFGDRRKLKKLLDYTRAITSPCKCQRQDQVVHLFPEDVWVERQSQPREQSANLRLSEIC